LGPERIPQTQDADVAYVPGDSASWIPCLPAFNVSLLDALRVSLKVIQERIGHALTGSFTLDVYGGQPEWERNLDAARMAGAEIERAVEKLKCATTFKNSVSLTAIQVETAPEANSEAVEN
jgi:hypothetical protein